MSPNVIICLREEGYGRSCLWEEGHDIIQVCGSIILNEEWNEWKEYLDQAAQLTGELGSLKETSEHKVEANRSKVRQDITYHEGWEVICFKTISRKDKSNYEDSRDKDTP